MIRSVFLELERLEDRLAVLILVLEHHVVHVSVPEQRVPAFEIRVGEDLFVASCPIGGKEGKLRKGQLELALGGETILTGGGYLH